MPEKNTFGILLPQTAVMEEDYRFCSFYVYDAYTGELKDKVKVGGRDYIQQGRHLRDNEPRHIIVNGGTEFVEDRQSHYQEIRAYEYNVLPGRISIPDSLVSTVEPQIAPLKLKPSHEKGYHVIADES